MRRTLIGLVVMLCLLGWLGAAQAGGYGYRGYQHHGQESFFWWGLGAGAVLGIFGAYAARPYAPPMSPYAYGSPYPPVIVQRPMVTHWYCGPYGQYYPSVAQCPVPWTPVQVPY